MALTTYTELKAAVASWLNRDDLTALIPDFITLAEERASRTLRVRQMEAELTATAIADGYIALPDTAVGVKTIWIVGDDDYSLQAENYEFIISHDTGGDATHWALAVDRIYFNGSGTVEGLLYLAIPALSGSNPANWLLTLAPSAYLFGALSEACLYVQDLAAAKLWASRFDFALQEIAASDMRDRLSGPLRVSAQ